MFEVANVGDNDEKVAEDDPNVVNVNTLRRNKVSVKDLSQQFEDQSRHSSSSIDQVVLRTRAHRFEKPQRKSSVTDSDNPEQVRNAFLEKKEKKIKKFIYRVTQIKKDPV